MLDPSLIPLVQRLDRDPEDREAIDTLTRELDGRGEHEVLAMLLEKVAGRRRTPEGSVDLLHRAALTWSGKVGDDPRALGLWKQVLDAQPAHEGAQLGLATIFRRTNRGDQAEAIYRRLLEQAISPAKKVPVLEALATLQNERDQPEREIETRRSLETARGPGAAATSNRRALAKLLVERSRRRAATTPLAEGEVDPDRREAAALLGAVAKEGATGRAGEFAQAALTLWPGDENAFEVAEESAALKQSELTTLRIQYLAANPRGARSQRVRRDLADAYVATQRPEDAIAVLSSAVDDDAQAAQSLAKLYEKLQRHLDLAKLLDRFPTPVEGAAKVALLRRRAAAWKAAAQKPQHLAALRTLLDEVPAEAEALAEIERDCRLQGLLGELRDRLRAAAAVEGVEASSRVRWLREVAQLAERRFDDLADARAAWELLERVADKAEDRAEAQDALLRLMARGEDWDRVLERLAAQAEAEADASEARRLWMRWVTVRREHRPDAARESAVLEKLWTKSPDNDAVARALVDARRRAGDDLGVTEVLYALIERAGLTNAASRWCQLAEHLERVGDLESSAEAWQSARTIDPTSALAWEAEARVLGAMGDREKQLTSLVAYADHPVAAGRRAGELYARAAQLAYDLGRKERATQLAERALRFNPGDEGMKGLVATLDDPGTAPIPIEELMAEANEMETVKLVPVKLGEAKPEVAKPEVAVKAEVATPEVAQSEEVKSVEVVELEALKPEVARAEEAPEAEEPTGSINIERDAADEPTSAIVINRDMLEEPTGAVAIPDLPVEEPTGAIAIVEQAAAPAAPADTAPPTTATAPAMRASLPRLSRPPPAVRPSQTPFRVPPPAVESLAELSDDLLEEIDEEPEAPPTETTPLTVVSPPMEAVAPVVVATPAAVVAPIVIAPLVATEVDHEERTPLQGVMLPEGVSITAELQAPVIPPIDDEPAVAPASEPAPPVAKAAPLESVRATAELHMVAPPPAIEAPIPASVTAELPAVPAPPVAAAAPIVAPPDEDSMIIDESLFGDPSPPAVAPPSVVAAPPIIAPPPVVTAPPVVAAPPVVTTPPIVAAPPAPASIPAPAPRASVTPSPVAPSTPPRQRIATGIPPTMPLPAMPAPVFVAPLKPPTPEPAPPPPVRMPTPEPAPPPPVLQFNPQPIIELAPPPPVLQFNPQPIVDLAPPPPALQFNPQPIIEMAPPPPALQFNPQPIIEMAPPPPALQFNPQPIIEMAPPPPALQFNPQPTDSLLPQSSPGDPFGRSSGDWAVDASGDPFASVAPAPPAPAPPAPAPPAPAAAAPPAFAFERVLLPMFEQLINDRH